MTPIERYEQGQLVERKSWVPATAMASSVIMGLSLAFFGGPVGNSPVGRPPGGGVVAPSGGVVAILKQATPGDTVPVLFNSNWATATGITKNAVEDGGNWSSGSTNDTVHNSVWVCDDSLSSLPAFWPTNCLRGAYTTGNAGTLKTGEPEWALPAVGDSVVYRFFMYNTFDSLQSSTVAGSGNFYTHGWESNVGTIEHAWRIFAGGISEFRLDLCLGPCANATTYTVFGVPKDTPLTVEVIVIRFSDAPDSAEFSANVYDHTVSTTVPLFDSDDFLDNHGAGSNTLTAVNRFPVTSEQNAFRQYINGWSDQNGWSGECCLWATAMLVSIRPAFSFVPNGGN